MTRFISKRRAHLKEWSAQHVESVSCLEAVRLLKQHAMDHAVKFKQSLDLIVMLNLDPKKSDQNIRGVVTLPHSLGVQRVVAVFASGQQADAAKAAGADYVGMEDLADILRNTKKQIDVVIATPDSMRVVGTLGQVLGPRGLMPNLKTGTVTMDVSKAVNDAKSGQSRYRLDKNGIVHCKIGHVGLDDQALFDNIQAVVQRIKQARPSTSKGTYIKLIRLTSTMGPSVLLSGV